MRRNREGFSLGEVLIALAVMGLALLGLVTVLASGVKAQDKTSKSVVARSVASRVMDRTLNALATGSDGDVAAFWDSDISSQSNPYDDGHGGKEVVGTTEFAYLITALEIQRNGQPFGTASGGDGNRLKQVTVTVRWAADGAQARAGTGKQEIQVSQLVNRSQP